MGIDIGAMFQDMKNTAAQGMNDLLKQGANAGLGYLEGQAVKVIQADQQQHEKDFQDATMAAIQRPTAAGSFGDYFSGLAKSPVLKSSGPYVLVAIAIVAVGAIFLARK